MKMIRGSSKQAGNSTSYRRSGGSRSLRARSRSPTIATDTAVSGRRIQVGDRASRKHVLRSASTRARFTHLPSVLISSWPRAGSLDYPVAIERNTCHVIFD
jgi:hypothetical protein